MDDLDLGDVDVSHLVDSQDDSLDLGDTNVDHLVEQPDAQQPDPSEGDPLAQQYLSQRNTPLLSKVTDAINSVPAMIGQPAGQLAGNIPTAVKEFTSRLATGNISPTDLLTGQPKIAAGALGATGVDLANVATQGLQSAQDFQKEHAVLGTIGQVLGGVGGILGAKKIYDLIAPAIGVDASPEEIKNAVERLKTGQTMEGARDKAMSVSPSQEASQSLIDAGQLAGTVGSAWKGAVSVAGKVENLVNPVKAVTSTTVASPVSFTKPVNGKVVGTMADVIDAPTKNLIDRSLGTEKGVAEGAMEAIRNDPNNTTNLVGLKASSDNAIQGLLSEVRGLKAKVGSVGNPMTDIADKLEGMITKGMSEPDKEFVQKQAAVYRDQAWSVDDMHDHLKYLGQKLIPFWTNPETSKFQQSVLANERSLVNDKFLNTIKEVGGDRATKLHKTMSNLIKLNQAVDDKVEKLAKTIPPDLRGHMSNAESTVAFLFGLRDLAHNPLLAAGEMTLAAKKWLKGADKEFFTNPNKMIERVNQNVRKKVSFTGSYKPYVPTPKPPSLEAAVKGPILQQSSQSMVPASRAQIPSLPIDIDYHPETLTND